MSLPSTNKIATAGTLTATTSSQEILAANTRRRWAIICNSGANGLWLGFGVAAVVGTGVYVPPSGGTLVIDGDNRWQGSVTGILAAATSVIGTMELK